MAELISVVIPAFNSEATIERAVRSVLDQDWPALEIIVVDDVSSDRTVDVVERLSDSRVTLARLAENGGGGVARNKGIDLAKGVYTAFLDADDYWGPTKLSNQMEALRERSNPFETVVYNAIGMVMADGIVTRPSYPWDAGRPIDEYMSVERQIIQTSGLLVPSAMAKRVRFDDSLRKHQDNDFVLALHRDGAEFLFCARPTVFYSSEMIEGRVSLAKRPERTIVFVEKWRHYMSPLTVAYYMTCSVAPMVMTKNPFMSASLYCRHIRFVPRLAKDILESIIFWNAPYTLYSKARELAHRVRSLARPGARKPLAAP